MLSPVECAMPIAATHPTHRDLTAVSVYRERCHTAGRIGDGACGEDVWRCGHRTSGVLVEHIAGTEEPTRTTQGPSRSWEPVAVNVCREVFHIPYGGGKNDMVGVAATETHSAVGVRVEGTQSTQDCANYTWQGQTA